MHIYHLIGGELNYPIGIFSVDIALKKEKIYLEYDGGGHALSVKLGSMTEKQFRNRGIARYQYLKRRGWKEIRLISPKDSLPEDEKINKWINQAIQLVKKGYNWVNIDVENGEIECKNR